MCHSRPMKRLKVLLSASPARVLKILQVAGVVCMRVLHESSRRHLTKWKANAKPYPSLRASYACSAALPRSSNSASLSCARSDRGSPRSNMTCGTVSLPSSEPSRRGQRHRLALSNSFFILAKRCWPVDLYFAEDEQSVKSRHLRRQSERDYPVGK
jgi:hypothetical protein